MLAFHVFVQSQAAHALLTFDDALNNLSRLPRMFIEPDGSLVWTGTADGQAWQVDGNLIDQGDVLSYVELKGRCPEEQLDQLLAALGWPEQPLTFQLPQRGIFLAEAPFRIAARSSAGAV